MKKIIILLTIVIILFTGCSDNNSIGIIGGSDGPTAVYIASSSSWLDISILIAIVVIILAIIILYIKRKRR